MSEDQRQQQADEPLTPQVWLWAQVKGHQDWLAMNQFSDLPDPKGVEHVGASCWKCSAWKAAHQPWDAR